MYNFRTNRIVVPIWNLMQRGMSTRSKTKEKSPLAPKFDFDLDVKVRESIKEGDYKAKQHPGVQRIKCISLPSKLQEAIPHLVADYPEKQLTADAKAMNTFIWSRHPPLEGLEYEEKYNQVKQKVMLKEKLDPTSPHLSEENRKRMQDSLRSKIHIRMKKEVYNWKPIEYDEYKSIVYAIARLSPDFASLVKVLSEIQKRDANFYPETVFDFGSGVGSGMWAVDSVWPNTCKEVMCVDASSEMNTIADKLLRGGKMESGRFIREGGTIFKQYLPLSDVIKYNLVISSRSLLELPNMESRLRTLDILWRKTNGYLVIIEAGTNCGYKVVLEARDYILQLGNNSSEDINSLEGHTFAPCPHEKFCPRYFDGSYTPCNIGVKYEPFSLSGKTEEARKDVYSYVVLKKGRNENTERYPRVVREPLLRKNHIICRVCTRYGTLFECTATKGKHNRECYNVFKHSNVGDLLPIVLPEPESVDVQSHGDLTTEHSLEDDGEAKV